MFTIFLPVTFVLSLLGPAIVGFGATAAIVAFLIGLFTQQWAVVGIAVYWWVGAAVSQAELRWRGYY